MSMSTRQRRRCATPLQCVVTGPTGREKESRAATTTEAPGSFCCATEIPMQQYHGTTEWCGSTAALHRHTGYWCYLIHTGRPIGNPSEPRYQNVRWQE